MPPMGQKPALPRRSIVVRFALNKQTLTERVQCDAMCQKETNGTATIYTASRDLALSTRKAKILLWTNCSSFHPRVEQSASLDMFALLEQQTISRFP
jgi:hypothetical protein